jgi:hypothetical protein
MGRLMLLQRLGVDSGLCGEFTPDSRSPNTLVNGSVGSNVEAARKTDE